MARRRPIPTLSLPQEYRFDARSMVEEYRTKENGVWSGWTIWDDEPNTTDKDGRIMTHGRPDSATQAWADEIFGEDDRSPMWVPPEVTFKAAEVVNFLSSADQLPADMVNLPPHYSRFKIEPMRFSVENNLNALQHSIVKYILRYDAKNGMEDLKKARRCLDMLIKWVEGDVDWWRKAA